MRLTFRLSGAARWGQCKCKYIDFCKKKNDYKEKHDESLVSGLQGWVSACNAVSILCSLNIM